MCVLKYRFPWSQEFMGRAVWLGEFKSTQELLFASCSRVSLCVLHLLYNACFHKPCSKYGKRGGRHRQHHWDLVGIIPK